MSRICAMKRIGDFKLKLAEPFIILPVLERLFLLLFYFDRDRNMRRYLVLEDLSCEARLEPSISRATTESSRVFLAITASSAPWSRTADRIVSDRGSRPHAYPSTSQSSAPCRQP